MSIAFLFWLIYIIWVIFGFYPYDAGNRWGYGRHLVVAVLIFLLGWRVFGFPIHG